MVTDDEKKIVNQMIDAAVFYFRKRRAKEKRVLDPRAVYQAFLEEATERLRDPGEPAGGR